MLVFYLGSGNGRETLRSLENSFVKTCWVTSSSQDSPAGPESKQEILTCEMNYGENSTRTSYINRHTHWASDWIIECWGALGGAFITMATVMCVQLLWWHYCTYLCVPVSEGVCGISVPLLAWRRMCRLLLMEQPRSGLTCHLQRKSNQQPLQTDNYVHTSWCVCVCVFLDPLRVSAY